jgi:succinyl-diaminopimelate desuccinylase
MIGALLQDARRRRGSVLELAAQLVKVPSRGGVDDYGPVLAVMEDWLSVHALPSRRLTDASGEVVGLLCVLEGGSPGPTWVLDACLDTAPVGDESAWLFPVLAGDVVDGWLRGRGSADSKSGAAVFAHVVAGLASQREMLHGRLALLFDVDEHTGGFGGALAAFTGSDALANVAGVMIGYPGVDELVVGGRGVLRANLTVYGVAAHSGSRRTAPNAVLKAADLVRMLAGAPLSDDGDFPVPPKLTVTHIEGGAGFSVVPDVCRIGVDVRLTEAFDAGIAEKLLHDAVEQLDAVWVDSRPSHVEVITSWPAYRLDAADPLVDAILAGARQVGLALLPKVAGPSNIGNLLAGLGIPATSGFGLPYEGLHAANEQVRIDALPQVHAAYAYAVRMLLGIES